MAQSPVRQRAALGGVPMVDVVCPRCSKRLASLWPSDSTRPRSYIDGIFYAHPQRSYHPGVNGARILAVPHEDWLSIRCPRCRFTWQGREQTLRDLLVGALGRKTARVHLPDT